PSWGRPPACRTPWRAGGLPHEVRAERPRCWISFSSGASMESTSGLFPPVVSESFMPAGRTATFLNLLRDSRLLEPAQRAELGRPPEAGDEEPRRLIKEVLRRGWLTRYQMTEVVQGRGRQLVLGPYRLRNLLGIGGMGQVFEAHPQPMDRRVALKV